MSLCSKPGCARPGLAVLGYDYSRQLVVLFDATSEAVSPHEYLLCGPCSERLRPPRGWSLDDRRASHTTAEAVPVDLRLVDAQPAERSA